MIRETFAADLLGTAAFAHRVDHLDPIGVDDPEPRRGSQEDLRPVLMRYEEAKEPGALGERGKQRPIVAREPPIKRPVAPTFEGMEDPQGPYFTWPQGGVRMLGDAWEMVIHLAE